MTIKTEKKAKMGKVLVNLSEKTKSKKRMVKKKKKKTKNMAK
jgi:hypothetical protein